MARQTGVVKIKGTIDGFTFYQSQDGSLVRKKTSLDKNRVDTDPKFLRTRENNKEFSLAASAGKLLRATMRSLMVDASDNRAHSRVTGVLTRVKKLDAISPRGNRTVANGIGNPDALQLLRDFDFNKNATLSSVLFAPFYLDKSTGALTISDFNPASILKAPEGATHVSLEAAFIKLDFAGDKGEFQVSPIQNIPIHATSSNVVLQPTAVPTLSGTSFYLLKVSFFQLVNGIEYSLRNGNALTIVDVD